MTSLARPSWIRVRSPNSSEFTKTHQIMSQLSLKTVCQEASCPNIGECWTKQHATFMILGDTCTRACRFCNVKTGIPNVLNPHEPLNVASAVEKLQLKHVVITSVDRDDLKDGGAQHFVNVIQAIRQKSPQTTIEILTPDFRRKKGAIETVARVLPDVFNHNLETVPRLYTAIRPGARYFGSLLLLKIVKDISQEIFTKSGIMVGLGETKEEVLQVMDDLREASVDFLTIGQYLRPSPKHTEIKEYVTPQQFNDYAMIARGKGFLMVSSSPLTRSSYHADSDFQNLKIKRQLQQS